MGFRTILEKALREFVRSVEKDPFSDFMQSVFLVMGKLQRVLHKINHSQVLETNNLSSEINWGKRLDW